jgi:CTP:molybdopterin cytidylyltransferase MocA
LFDRTLFGQLDALRGDVGARRVIEAHPALSETVPFPAGSIDIDTKVDWCAISIAVAPGPCDPTDAWSTSPPT